MKPVGKPEEVERNLKLKPRPARVWRLHTAPPLLSLTRGLPAAIKHFDGGRRVMANALVRPYQQFVEDQALGVERSAAAEEAGEAEVTPADTPNPKRRRTQSPVPEKA
eukprot:m.141434 g.141434  ORF g.141434 m.141434 type:complete len:108 (+) comp10023_c0_seq1:1828-2151(+)